MGATARRGFGAQQCDARERRPAALFTFLQRAGGERLVAALQQQCQQRMIGILRLDQHFARPLGATRATGDLHDRLRQPLAGAKVRAEQALVGVQHHDQRDVRKIVALGQHLRADEDADLVAVDARQRRFQLALAAACCRDRCAPAARPETAARSVSSMRSVPCPTGFAPADRSSGTPRAAVAASRSDGRCRSRPRPCTVRCASQRRQCADQPQRGTEQHRRVAAAIQEQHAPGRRHRDGGGWPAPPASRFPASRRACAGRSATAAAAARSPRAAAVASSVSGWRCARARLSSDGVAEPSTIGMPSRCARTIARSRAE